MPLERAHDIDAGVQAADGWNGKANGSVDGELVTSRAICLLRDEWGAQGERAGGKGERSRHNSVHSLLQVQVRDGTARLSCKTVAVTHHRVMKHTTTNLSCFPQCRP
jgi:hypothetical protein